MIALSSAIGLFGCALAIGLGVASLGRKAGPPLLLGSSILALVPLTELSAAGYLRGLTGDLSLTTLTLLLLLAIERLGGPELVDGRELRALLIILLGGALFLYPAALGLGPFDPYDLGFRPKGMLVGLVFVALSAWALRLDLLLACLLVAVFGYALDLHSSDNLWDYLIDPWIGLFALGWIVRKRL